MDEARRDNSGASDHKSVQANAERTPADDLRSNLLMSLAIAICGVVIVVFPYYADYGSAWSGRFFFFGYAIMVLGFFISAVVSAAHNVGRGFLLTGVVVLIAIAGMDLLVSNLGRNSNMGSAVELIILIFTFFAIFMFALGFSNPTDPNQSSTQSNSSTQSEETDGAQPISKINQTPLERRTPAVIAALALLTAVLQVVDGFLK